MPRPEQPDHAVELPLDRDAVLAAVNEAAEVWGAVWHREGSGGRLTLPVTAGLRHGRLDGRIWTEPARGAGSGTRLLLRVEESHYTLHWRAVVILLFGAVGGLAITLWPFYPPLLGFVPVAIVLTFAAWFLVASRLRTAGVEEFLELLVDKDR